MHGPEVSLRFNRFTNLARHSATLAAIHFPPQTRRRIALLAIAFSASLAVFFALRKWSQTPRSHIDVYDGFETATLSRIWDIDRFEPGAVTFQSNILRAGRAAAKIVLHSRDKFEAGINGDADSERAELSEPVKLFSRENKTYQYSFSMFIPPDFPVVPTRLIIAQWKQYCNGHVPCSNDAPIIAVRYASGALQITHQTGPHRAVLFQTAENPRGKWTDFQFQIRFTTHANGLLRAWLNGAQVVDYQGVNAYPENPSTGYADPSLFYFKMGLYRDVMAHPMTIYIDEYRKKDLPDGT